MKAREFLPLAEKEMNEAALFYEERSPGLGRDFLDAVQGTVDAIVAHPNSGFPRTFGGGLSRDSPSVFSIRSSPSELSSLPLCTFAVALVTGRGAWGAGKTSFIS